MKKEPRYFLGIRVGDWFIPTNQHEAKVMVAQVKRQAVHSACWVLVFAILVLSMVYIAAQPCEVSFNVSTSGVLDFNTASKINDSNIFNEIKINNIWGSGHVKIPVCGLGSSLATRGFT